MDYKRVYAEFIKDRREKEAHLEGYSERHHIVPRCMGGGDEAGNLIRLTAGDHFFAHLVLAKVHGGVLWYALNALVEGDAIGGRQCDRAFVRRARHYYQFVKVKFGRIHSKRMKGRFVGSAHPMYGRPCSPVALAKLLQRIESGNSNPMASAEAKAKVSAALKGRTFSSETRAKMSAAKLGFRHSDETRAAMSRSHTGKKLPPEVIAKTAEKLRGRPKSAEHIERMRISLTGRKLSAEHVQKLLPSLATKRRFKGRNHSEQTKRRMAAVSEAKVAYAREYGCDARIVTIEMIRKSGGKI